MRIKVSPEKGRRLKRTLAEKDKPKKRPMYTYRQIVIFIFLKGILIANVKIMFRILKSMRVPNVVEFNLKDKIIDNLALFLFDIIRNKESRFVKVTGTQRLSKSNAYLNLQFKRLIKYASKGELEKFNFLARTLMKNSKVFRNYAIQFVLGKHYLMNTIKLVNLDRRVTRLCKTESTELEYKRVWIDKKAGDYGRPLGVPTPEWRIYGHMLTRVMESFLAGRGYLTRNQHGGKAGFGVMTFLEELNKVLKTWKYLVEFDIKGYFDHVSHESMLQLLEGCYLKKQMSEILKREPKGYKLPPKEADEGYQEYMKNLRFDYVKVGNQVWYDLEILERSDKRWREENPGLIRLSKTYLIVEGDYYWLRNGSIESDRYLVPRDDITRRGKPITLDNSYKMLMEQGLISIDSFWEERDFKPSEESRGRGRDNWKDLREEGKGIPQGTSFGPLLASTVLGYRLRSLKALIYMDDGIIRCNSEATALNSLIDLKRQLSKIGCEVAPQKTRILGVKSLITEGVKLLGTRWTRVRTLFTYDVKSETRKGISRPLINVTKKDFEKVVERLYKAGLISPSKDSVIKRYLGISRNADLLQDSLLDLAVKHEIFGTILARAYSPESNVTDMAREIQYGIFKAEAKLAKYPWSSIGGRLYRDNIKRYLSEEGKICTTRVTLQNVATLSNDIFLAYMSKDLPVRSKLIYNFYPRRIRKAVVNRIVRKLK